MKIQLDVFLYKNSPLLYEPLFHLINKDQIALIQLFTFSLDASRFNSECGFSNIFLSNTMAISHEIARCIQIMHEC